MNSIGIQFNGKPWMIRMPQLVRYMDRQYVEDFFATGNFRLSSWQACREAEDTERRDWSEGRYEGMIGNCTMAAFMSPAHLLCVSVVESAEMARTFQENAGVRIVHPLEFAHAVARRLADSDAGFNGGECGPCSYRDGKFDQLDVPTPDFDESRPEESLNAIEECVNRTALRTLFVKDIRFVHQAEWRFVWWINTPSSLSHRQIECPDAREFCEPVEFR